jgi:hypothetical protein
VFNFYVNIGKVLKKLSNSSDKITERVINASWWLQAFIFINSVLAMAEEVVLSINQA